MTAIASIAPVSVTLAVGLRAEVEKMIQDDPRMIGIAKYLTSVEIFWSRSIKTACAGHGFIFFNPDFWDRIPEQSRITVMAHEVWHLILKHLDRGLLFHPDDFNKAGDHVINNMLDNEGFTWEGLSPLKDPKYKGMSTEAVYNVIHAEKKKDGKGDGQNSDHPSKETMEELVKAAADAIAGNDHYDNVPKQIEGDNKTLEDLKESLGGATGCKHIKLEITGARTAVEGATYEEIFKEYLIDPISGARRSFMRPNRRMHGRTKNTFQIPGRVARKVKSNRLAHLIYALDVSGSITSTMVQQFHDSVRTIKELLNPNLLTVLFWDTQIKLIKTFKDTEPYGKIEVEGGGCTCLKEVYKYCATRDPDAVVIFTDLAVTILPEPKWHTIWLLTKKHREANVPKLYGDVHIIPEEIK